MSERLISTEQLSMEGMTLHRPAVALDRVEASPHPLRGAPDLWSLRIGTGGHVTDEVFIRPCEIPALREVLAQILSSLQDAEDDEETAR